MSLLTEEQKLAAAADAVEASRDALNRGSWDYAQLLLRLADRLAGGFDEQ